MGGVPERNSKISGYRGLTNFGNIVQVYTTQHVEKLIMF